MKRFSTSVLFLLSTLAIFANPLHFKNHTNLFEHLAEVNQQWNVQKDIPKAFFDEDVHFESDIQRIQTHLKYVEQILRKRTTNHLSTVQKAKRSHHLDVLKHYWQASTFPTNTFHSHRQPYFVDIFGVHCAVGYLLQQDGQDAFIEKIRAKDNYAYIHELTKYSELGEWATENGFTIDELAWIQPGYGAPSHDFQPVGNNGGVVGDIHVMKTNPDSTMLLIGGDFTSVDGVATRSLIGWDGTNWHTFGNEIDGTIYDMTWDNGSLIVVGYFTLNGQMCNIARRDGSSWTALQTGDMQGSIYTILITSYRMYIGGDFQKVDGQTMPFLAYKTTNTGWKNTGRDNMGVTILNAFSVNAPVRRIRQIANQILVGGLFTQTAPNATDSTMQLSATYLAYWDNFRWTYALNGPNAPVNEFIEHDNKLFVVGNANVQVTVTVFDLGIWTDLSQNFHLIQHGYTDNFIEFGNRLLLVGDFDCFPINGNYGRSIAEFFGGWPNGVASADSTITSGTVFQGKVFLGGKFTSISGDAVNQLASSALDGTSSTNEIEGTSFKVFSHQQHVIVEQKNILQQATLQIINPSGQIVFEKQLNENNRQEIPVNYLPKGVYFYQLINEKMRQTGKLSIF